MKRIELERAAQIHTILALCRSRGLDPVKILDEGRLLRHVGTRSEDAARVLEHVIEVIRQAPVSHEVKTPLDMKNMIIELLERMCHAYTAQ